jgi:hypothetical protein
MAFFLGQQDKKPQAHCSDAFTACLSEGCFAAACDQAELEREQTCGQIHSALELQSQHLSEGVCENVECESDCEEEEDIGCEDSSCAYWETQCGSSGRIGSDVSSVITTSVYSHIRMLASRNDSRIFSSHSTFGYC